MTKNINDFIFDDIDCTGYKIQVNYSLSKEKKCESGSFPDVVPCFKTKSKLPISIKLNCPIVHEIFDSNTFVYIVLRRNPENEGKKSSYRQFLVDKV